MPNYQAGSLEVTIDGISTGAEKSLTAVARSLNSLQKSLTAFNNLPTGTIGLKLRVFFNDIDTALLNLNKNSLNTFNVFAKGINSLGSISKIGKIDFEKTSSGFKKLTTAISPFLDRIDKSSNALNSLYGVLSKASSKKLNSIGQGDNKKKGGFGLFGITKLASTIYLARRLATTVGGILKAGSDYTETLNLWQVAMRKNLDVATDFVSKMNEAYSISRKTLMQAQATFKNMIGSLGDLTDETSYALSEAITQMAIDYASLYNVAFDEAINKFQSALAGQVRPIRSVSGYDITEKTIHALYESLGGTKTMRQLSRTEKQLLAIYAVFNQMDASGALGDMNKTIDRFANQSRMAAENWSEITTWIGVIVVHLIETSGIMQYINAGLIFMSRLLEGIAGSIGAGKENFIDGIFESATDTTKAVEELQGKLLDFDKFRSLSGGETNPLKLDETVLKALSKYNSYLGKADNTAQNLADQWLIASGLFDENGVFQKDKWDELVDSAEHFASIIGMLVTGKLLYNFGNGIAHIFKNIKPLEIGTMGLVAGLSMLVYAMGYFISKMDKLDSTAKILIPTISILVGLVTALAVAKTALFKGNWAAALGLGAMVASVGIMTGTAIANPEMYAKGASNIDSGTLFVAGEMGKTEAVYNGTNGKTNVANIQQMKSAYSQALTEWWRYAKNDLPAFKEVSGTGIYEINKSEMRRRGEWNR